MRGGERGPRPDRGFFLALAVLVVFLLAVAALQGRLDPNRDPCNIAPGSVACSGGPATPHR